jgi:hypothetical protein
MNKEQLLQCIEDSFNSHIEGIKNTIPFENHGSIKMFEIARNITLSEINMRPYDELINPDDLPF